MRNENEVEVIEKKERTESDTSSTFSSIGSEQTIKWNKTAFELIAKHDNRIFSEELMASLNKSYDDDLEEENDPVNFEDIEKIVSYTNPKFLNYLMFFHTFLNLNSDETDLTKYYATLLSGLSKGVTLSPEDLLGIFYLSDHDVIRKNISDSWAILLENKVIDKETTRTFVMDLLDETPESIEQSYILDEMDTTRAGTHITKLKHSLMSTTLLDPRSLADLNKAIKKFYDKLREAYENCARELNLFRPDVTKEEIENLLRNTNHANKNKSPYKNFIQSSVDLYKTYVSEVVKWGAMTPTIALRVAFNEIAETLENYMPIFIRAFSAKRHTVSFGYDFYAVEELPNNQSLSEYDNAFIWQKKDKKIYCIKNGIALEIEIKKNKDKKLFGQLKKIFENKNYQHLTLTETKKLLRLTNSYLPFSGNCYFMAEVEHLKPENKKRRLMAIVDVISDKTARPVPKLIRIEEELFKAQFKKYEKHVKNIIGVVEKINDKIVEKFYLIIEDEDKKKIVLKLNPDNKRDIGVSLVKTTEEESNLIIRKDEEREVRFKEKCAKLAEEERLTQDYNNKKKFAIVKHGMRKKTRTDKKLIELENSMKQKHLEIELLNLQGCMDEYVYRAVSVGKRIIPVPIYQAIVNFFAHTCNGSRVIPNYLKDFRKSLEGKYPLEIIDKFMASIHLYFLVTFVTPPQDMANLLPHELTIQLPRNAEDQKKQTGVHRDDSFGLQYLRFRMMDDFLAGNLEVQQYLIDGMPKFAPSQTFDKNKAAKGAFFRDDEYKKEIVTEDIRSNHADEIAKWHHEMLLTFRYQLPPVDGKSMHLAMKKFRSCFNKIFAIKDICKMGNDYFMIAEIERSFKNPQKETVIMKLFIENEMIPNQTLKNEEPDDEELELETSNIEWKEVTDPEDCNKVSLYSNDCLRRDHFFFQVEIATVLMQNFSLQVVIKHIKDLNVEVKSFIETPLDFITFNPNPTEVFLNLIQFAALKKNYEFFEWIKDFIDIAVIKQNIENIQDKLDQSDDFYQYITLRNLSNPKIRQPSTVSKPSFFQNTSKISAKKLEQQKQLNENEEEAKKGKVCILT